MNDSKKSRRLCEYLRQGRSIFADVAWSAEGSGEPGTTMVNMWRVDRGYRLKVEVYLDKNMWAEDNYMRDELLDFDTLESAIAYIEKDMGIPFEKMHA